MSRAVYEKRLKIRGKLEDLKERGIIVSFQATKKGRVGGVRILFEDEGRELFFHWDYLSKELGGNGYGFFEYL